MVTAAPVVWAGTKSQFSRYAPAGNRAEQNPASRQSPAIRRRSNSRATSREPNTAAAAQNRLNRRWRYPGSRKITTKKNGTAANNRSTRTQKRSPVSGFPAPKPAGS